MKYILLTITITLTQDLIGQENLKKIDLSHLSGEYNELKVYALDMIELGPFMEMGPKGKTDIYSCIISYNPDTKSGYIKDSQRGEREYRLIEADTTYIIKIKTKRNLKKGIIERCDPEMVSIKFEQTLEEYIRKHKE